MGGDWLDITIRLFALLLLVGMNGFFVAAEFSLVNARRTRIEQLANEGNLLARTVRHAMRDPNRFISVAQVGITIASLALGWVGEPALSRLVEPLVDSFLPEQIAFITSHAIGIALAFSIITFLHLVLGEQVPKMMAMQRAEGTILITAQVTQVVGVIFRPLIAIVYWSTEGILRLLGLQFQEEGHMVYTVDELEMLVEASQEGGQLDARERDLLHRAFTFSEMTAGQIMVPRTEVVGIEMNASYDEMLAVISEAGRSRYPVYEQTIDQVLGVIHVKDLITIPRPRPEQRFDIRHILREIVPVPESVTIDDLLTTFQRQRAQMALIVDDFGGTAGLVTIEDVIEVLVGQIQDEFEPLELEIETRADGSASVDGLVLLDEFNRQFAVSLDSDAVETLGGYVFETIGRKPEVGDTVETDGYSLAVEELDGLRISRICVMPLEAENNDDDVSRMISS